MSGTTIKHDNFVRGPMGDKDVTELPRVGAVLGKTLAEREFGKAYQVVGQFMVLGKNEEKFRVCAQLV